MPMIRGRVSGLGLKVEAVLCGVHVPNDPKPRVRIVVEEFQQIPHPEVSWELSTAVQCLPGLVSRRLEADGTRNERLRRA